MTIDKIVVSLDPVSRNDILVKKVDEKFKEKKVRDLVNYMLDISADDSNPGYNESEQQVATMISGWIEQAKSSPDSYEFVVAAKPVNGGDPTPLQLENKLSNYESQILQSRPIPGEDQSASSPYIELFARLDEISGGLYVHKAQINLQRG